MRPGFGTGSPLPESTATGATVPSSASCSVAGCGGPELPMKVTQLKPAMWKPVFSPVISD